MTAKLWFNRLVLQDVFELMIQCCGSPHRQNFCGLSGRLEKSHALFGRKKVISGTIFQPRVIIGLALHIYCPYWSVRQHLSLESMHYTVVFLNLLQNSHYYVCHVLYLRNLNVDERIICIQLVDCHGKYYVTIVSLFLSICFQ